MVPEMGPTVDPNPVPLWGAQVLRNTRNSKMFGVFDLSEVYSFGFILDTFWAQFRDPRISELFRNLMDLIQAVKAK